MKCKACGKGKMGRGVLKEKGYWGVDFVWKGSGASNIMAFACEECGHVVLYLRDKVTKEMLEEG